VIAYPRVVGGAAAIRAKTELALSVEHDIDQLHHAVNEIRKTRDEFARVSKAVSGHQDNAALATDADALSKRLDPIEQTLMQVNMKGSEANLAFPGMLNELLASFALSIDDADTPPTEQHVAFYQSLHGQLGVQLDAWRDLRDGAIASFNAKLKSSGIPPVRPGVE